MEKIEAVHDFRRRVTFYCWMDRALDRSCPHGAADLKRAKLRTGLVHIRIILQPQLNATSINSPQI
jgi:hypothetical protein